MKIFVNGTFDVLHIGHIRLLEYAKSLGEYLMVAIDGDERIKAKKGKDRPFNKLFERVEMLQSIKYVDQVDTFNTDAELEEIIKFFQPDIMIVGSDWKGKAVIGSEYAKELRFFDRIDGYSTTRILDKK